jgi:hypothetical protein
MFAGHKRGRTHIVKKTTNFGCSLPLSFSSLYLHVEALVKGCGGELTATRQHCLFYNFFHFILIEYGQWLWTLSPLSGNYWCFFCIDSIYGTHVSRDIEESFITFNGCFCMDRSKKSICQTA